MTTLYLVWYSFRSQDYINIGKLQKVKTMYVFTYNIEGAVKAQNEGCTLPFKTDKVMQVSNSLFPFFQNRIMNPQRANINNYLKRLNLNNYDELKLLEKTKGIKLSDNFQILSEEEFNMLQENDIQEKRI